MAHPFRPIFAVDESERGFRDILLNNVEYFGAFSCAHEKHFSRLEYSDFGDSFDIGLAVADLTQDRLCKSRVSQTRGLLFMRLRRIHG